MEKPKTNFLSDFQKNILKMDLKTLKIVFYAILIAVAVILIWGYFYGISQVPRPEPSIQPFQDSLYQHAGEFYIDPAEFIFIGRQTFQQEILDNLNEDIQPGAARDMAEKLAGSKRFVVLEAIDDSIMNATITIRHDQLKGQWEKELQTLERKMEEASFFDRSTYSDQIAALRRKLEAAGNLVLLANNLRVKSRVSLPYENKIGDFRFVAGTLDGILFLGNYQYVFRFSDGRPVTTRKFLEKAGVPELVLADVKLNDDADLLKSIKKEDFNKYAYELKRMEDRISAQIGPEREFHRNKFYKKWFMILVMALISYLMLRILLWYYTLIRRKGLPKKTTHEVYFATNTSSLALRIIALIIVVLGIVWLGVNLALVIFAETSRYEFVADLGFWYGVVAPVATVIFTVVLSWSFVLWSEFICFLSNCYHVLFVKAYEDRKEK